MDRASIRRTLYVSGALTFLWIVVHFALLVPLIAETLAEQVPAYAAWRWPGMILLWLVGACCLTGLWEFWRVARRIAADRSFCRENAASFRRISLLAFIALGLLAARAVMSLLVTGLSIHALFLFSAGIPAQVLGMLTRCLARLIDRAAALQEDSDFTI